MSVFGLMIRWVWVFYTVCFLEYLELCLTKSRQSKNVNVWVGDVVSWDISVRRPLRQSELVEFESLSSLLANVILCRDSTCE